MKTAEQITKEITDGVIWKILLYFFFPILLGTFFQQLYNTVDAVIVGNYVGTEALASVGGSTGTIINLIVGFFTGLSSGATVIVSQFWGAKQKAEISKGVHTSIALSLVGGGVLTIVGLVIAPTILGWMNTPKDIMEYSEIYLKIYFLGLIPSLLYNMASGILRAIGDSKRPLYYLIVACMVNVILDIVFVVILKQGVAGVAWATVISQIVSAILVMIRLLTTSLDYKVKIKEIKFNPNVLRNIIRIGLPAGIQAIMYSLSNMLIQSSINSLGTETVAAWTAYGKLDTIYWMMLGAFGISITTFVGQNYGAGNFERIKKGTKICLGMTMVTSVFLSVGLLSAGPFVLSIFTTDPIVITIGLRMVQFLVPFYITFTIVEIVSGTLRACGDAFIPMCMTFVGICVLRFIWIMLVVPMYPTLETIMLSYPMAWIVTSFMFIIYYKKGKWLH